MARKKYEDQGKVRKTIQICVQNKMIEEIGLKKCQQIAVEAIEDQFNNVK